MQTFGSALDEGGSTRALSETTERKRTQIMTTIENIREVEGTPHAQIFPESEPKTIRLTLEEGERVEPHRHPGREIVFYVISGAIELRVGAETHRLDEGDIARFGGEQDISPVATERSTALIVLAHRPG
jgi:quercetin dioxygenase-like cupin family protein